MTSSIFITGTGTDVGKTYVAAGMLHALSRYGHTIGVKPYETGVESLAGDEARLQQASSHDKSRTTKEYRNRYFRAKQPLAPAAVPDANLPSLADMKRRIESDIEHADYAVIEGAGGLLVPIGHGKTIADLIALMKMPAILVTYNGLGTLSHTLTAWESMRARGIAIPAVVLNSGACDADESQQSNASILSTYGVGPIVQLGRDDVSFGALVERVFGVS